MATLLTDIDSGRQSTVLAHTLRGEAAHLPQLLNRIERYARQCWGVVCGGSIPPGLPAESYAAILDVAHQRGLISLLDSSGEGLRHGVARIPHILKVNAREMAELDERAIAHWQSMDTQPATDGLPIDLHWLADYLIHKLGLWARQAIITTVGQRGALAVTEEGRYYAPALEVKVVSPAGAGDGVSAGLMLARHQGKGWRHAIAFGMATAAAVVSNPGTAECSPAEVNALLPQVEVYEL
jgi:6-phosphofructokinase 2